jgi:hypothetical protein
MKRFLSIQSLDDLNPVKEIFKLIIVELKEIWGKAAIPIKDDKNILKDLIKIHDAWLSIKKIPVSRRNNSHSISLIGEFEKRMDSLLDISPSDVEVRLRATRKRHWKEDFSFLIGQRQNPQVGFMEKVDQQEQNKQNNKKIRDLRVNRNPSAESSSHIQEETAYISSETEEDIPNCGSSEDDNYEPRRTPRPESITIEIPAKNLSKVTAESRNITLRDHLTIQSSFVNADGGYITDMSLSLTTVHRQRRKMRQEISDEIREKWIPPPFLPIHWNSKLIR